MKKRIYKNILILFTALFAMTSCFNLDEDVLDTVPYDDFGKTEAEVNAIVGPVYQTLCRYAGQHNFMVLHDGAGDMLLIPSKRGGDWWDGGQYREIHMHEWVVTNNSIWGGWNRCSAAISTANLVLYILSDNQVISDDLKKRLEAEVRGVRAFWLYIMMDNWGNIPLVTDYTKTELPTNTPRAEVFNFIISELNEIKEFLRDEVTSSSYGKFTRGAAYTLLAKMYLNAEAWGVGTAKWAEAEAALNEVLKLDYVIEDTWKTNFIAKNEVSREAILSACFSTNAISGYRLTYYDWLHYKDNLALGYKPSGNNCFAAQPDYVRLFDEADQRLHGSFLLGQQYDLETGEMLITAHDRPLNHTIDVPIIPGTERDGTVWGDVEQEVGGRNYKWEYEKTIVNAMENDWHIFRLADVYLMKAEVLVRQNKDNAEATRLVNVIRQRGFGNSDHNYTTVGLDEIALERKLEFAWEQMSRQDMIRFGTYQNARYLKPDTHGKDHLNIFLIPQQAWRSNNNLKQNPGYPAF